MSEPNPDDGLMADITEEFKNNHSRFIERAKQYTLRHATKTSTKGLVHSSAASTSSSLRTLCSSNSTIAVSMPHRASLSLGKLVAVSRRITQSNHTSNNGDLESENNPVTGLDEEEDDGSSSYSSSESEIETISVVNKRPRLG